MYQFVLANGVKPSYVLCTTHPSQRIPLENGANQSISGYQDVLIHVLPEENAEENGFSEMLNLLSDVC